MKKWSLFIGLVLTGSVIFVHSLNVNTFAAEKIRRPAVAGAFYPNDPKILSEMVDQLLAEANETTINGPLYGLIAPHAGYVYSGHVAAMSYILLKNRNLKQVIVISPSHVMAFRGAAIYDGDAYATPLGSIPVDKIFCKKLAAEHHLLNLSSDGHETQRAGRMEHALEIQLPFLQQVLDDFLLVPIILGDQNYETCRALGIALSKLMNTQNSIIIASSDLSHFHPYSEASILDRKVLNAIHEWDYFNMSRNFNNRIWEACGGGPIVAAMIASEMLGANEAKIMKYANSGDVSIGDKKSVVGYSAIALYKDKDQNKNSTPDFRLNKTEQKHLLNIARKSVETAVQEGKLYELKSTKLEALVLDRGAFVTLNKNNQLRGCIGFTSPLQPLYLTVRDAATSAALKDYRFKPVKEAELKQLTYEISVLSPFRKVLDIKQIQIGKHGLLIKKGSAEGLLLPQVATKYSWDRTTFLRQTCLKAGLPENAWEDSDSDIFLFSAFVFGEH
jgi:AmmeMemoRadiSam system protein B/AmmeMemoRadiSam system protein A